MSKYGSRDQSPATRAGAEFLGTRACTRSHGHESNRAKPSNPRVAEHILTVGAGTHSRPHVSAQAHFALALCGRWILGFKDKDPRRRQNSAEEHALRTLVQVMNVVRNHVGMDEGRHYDYMDEDWQVSGFIGIEGWQDGYVISGLQEKYGIAKCVKE
ncbi:uncharacterized protein SCHCODRAFT_02553716 [Schizophyllum commune H4-8]|uniref:Uncharacterized protein n=1 Tax=Schizophyllum commune (strain H4-8 / FGSC 9210) TaxID=578458 RepID=D8QGI8_SCHCM